MTTNQKTVVGGIVTLVLTVALAHWYVRSRQAEVPAANTNAATNVATNTPPAPPSGGYVGTFVNATAAMMQLEEVNTVSTTQVTLVGQAVGNWYFEASFPVEIRDNANNVIGTGHAEAQGDWMTVALVPFVANVTLNAPYSGPAVVILHKDNPSGEPVNDASVSYNVSL